MHFIRMHEDVPFAFSQQNAIQSQLGFPLGAALDVAEVLYGFGRPAYYSTQHQFQEFSKYAYGEWLQV